MKQLVKYLKLVFVSCVSMLVSAICALATYRLDECNTEIAQEEAYFEEVDLQCFATKETEDMLPLPVRD